jgi:hypothetical protein
LAERGWDGISVPAVCERADVGGDGRRPQAVLMLDLI